MSSRNWSCVCEGSKLHQNRIPNSSAWCMFVLPTPAPVTCFQNKQRGILKDPTTALLASTCTETGLGALSLYRYSGRFWRISNLADCVLRRLRSFISRCSESVVKNTFLPISLVCRARCFSRLIKAAGVCSGRGRKHVYLFFFSLNLSVNVFSFSTNAYAWAGLTNRLLLSCSLECVSVCVCYERYD